MDQLDTGMLMMLYKVLQASLRCDSNKSQLDALWGVLMQRFYDHGQGGLWFSQEAHRTLISRRIKKMPMIGQSLHQMLGLSQVQFRCLSDLINLNILKKPFIRVFFPAIIQAQHVGCDSFWLAIREFWASLAEPDSRVQVQFSVARWLGDDFWDIVVGSTC